MRLVIQRVKSASVRVAGETVSSIGKGLLVFAGSQEGDGDADIRFCAEKIRGLRIFEDENEKMNLSVADVGGEVLLVSQFTLLGDARRGRRPSFSSAEPPETARDTFDRLADAVRETGLPVQTGVFRAHMEVTLLNDGPVTILLDSRRTF